MTDENGTQGAENRAVGAALGIGIFLVPFVFAWFTLRKGYGIVARVVSLGWMAIIVLIAIRGPSHSDQSQLPESDANLVAESPTDAAIPPASQSAPEPHKMAKNTLFEMAEKTKECSNVTFLFGTFITASLGANSNNDDIENSTQMLKTTKASNEAAILMAIDSGISREEAQDRLKSVPDYTNYLNRSLSDDEVSSLKLKLQGCINYLSSDALANKYYKLGLDVAK